MGLEGQTNLMHYTCWPKEIVEGEKLFISCECEGFFTHGPPERSREDYRAHVAAVAESQEPT